MGAVYLLIDINRCTDLPDTIQIITAHVAIMKSKCILLITVLFSSHSAIALPSSYNLIPGLSRGRNLDTRFVGYVSDRDLFGRDDPAVCTTVCCLQVRMMMIYANRNAPGVMPEVR
jgi:hypothetical protein